MALGSLSTAARRSARTPARKGPLPEAPTVTIHRGETWWPDWPMSRSISAQVFITAGRVAPAWAPRAAAQAARRWKFCFPPIPRPAARIPAAFSRVSVPGAPRPATVTTAGVRRR